MKRTIFTALIGLTFVFVVIFGMTTGQAFGEKKLILKVQSGQPTTLPGSGDLSNTIKAASDGNIIMKIYEPGELVAPFEILDAVSEGRVDAGISAAGFWQGKIPAAAFFSAVDFFTTRINGSFRMSV